MKYRKIVEGAFIKRPNRFIAHVLIDGKEEVVHVKNTGRCKELLIPGVKVLLEESDNPARKTRYDLVTVYKEGLGWVNIDSQAPNKIAAEWLATQDFDHVKPEYTYGKSRIDFYMEKRNEENETERFLMEVKGCTLEINGIGYFPDAPTERGVKHLEELAGAAKAGYHCIIAFVIQMENITEVKPNVDTHPAFGVALEKAKDAGVEVIFICCRVDEGEVSWEQVIYSK